MTSFWVPGDPRPQPRPRAFARGGVARVYDPGTAEAWKSTVACAAARYRPESPAVGCVAVELHFYFRRPKRLMRKRDPDGPMPHGSKPDADNAAKAVLDALTAIGFWGDDAQVARLHVAKHYCAKGCAPGASVRIFRPGETPDDVL